jgi:hypothetical protein
VCGDTNSAEGQSSRPPIVRLSVVPVIALARSEATTTAMPASSSSVITRRVCDIPARYAWNCSHVSPVVNSALKRARAGLQDRLPAAAGERPSPAPGSPEEDALVARFVSAYEAADVDAIVEMPAGVRRLPAHGGR